MHSHAFCNLALSIWLLSRTALGTDEVTSCPRQGTTEGSRVPWALSLISLWQSPKCQACCSTYLTKRQKVMPLWGKNNINTYVFPLLPHSSLWQYVYIKGKCSKIVKHIYMSIKRKKKKSNKTPSNYEIKFLISKLGSQAIISTFQWGRC